MYQSELLNKWVWWRYKNSTSYRIAVVHAQERWREQSKQQEGE